MHAFGLVDLRFSLSTTFHSDTALGDWYVNRLVVDRQPLLLLASPASLLSVLVRARDVRALRTHIGDLVFHGLTRLGGATSLINAERRAMTRVRIGAMVDRSVLGIMVDFGKGVPYHLDAGRWDDAALSEAEHRLAETRCHAARRDAMGHVVFPEKRARELLLAAPMGWLTGG